MIIGYCRVSTSDQNLDRQTDQLQDVGCERIFKEKITGTKKDRPELNRLLDTALWQPPIPENTADGMDSHLNYL